MERSVFEQLAIQFNLDKTTQPQSLGEGHIHQTYLVQNKRQVVLQKVNTVVFPDQHMLMHNLKQVMTHLQRKQQQKIYPYEVLNLLPTQEGDDYWQMIKGCGALLNLCRVGLLTNRCFCGASVPNRSIWYV